MNRELLPALLSGLLFGGGLAVSGMADPQRVRGFLDIFGNWDPTLVFVMGGAVAVMVLAWLAQRRMSSPIAAARFSLPTRSEIDASLVVGAIIFGVGWGIAGLCPGPALIGLVLEPFSAIIFVLAMTAGMALFQLRPVRN